MAQVVERLRKWASIKDGEVVPPELMEDAQPGRWGEALRQLHTEAADEIELMRKFVDFYWATYAETQHHPTILEEAAAINSARELRKIWT